MGEPVSLLMLEFLNWVARQPRTYAQSMEAWRSTCPRTSVWEDALAAGFIENQNHGRADNTQVMLTERGREIVNGGSAGTTQ